MNKTIKNLERRKQRVLSIRNCFMWNSDKENLDFQPTMRKFDRVLDLIVKAIKIEWNKSYIR